MDAGGSELLFVDFEILASFASLKSYLLRNISFVKQNAHFIRMTVAH